MSSCRRQYKGGLWQRKKWGLQPAYKKQAADVAEDMQTVNYHNFNSTLVMHSMAKHELHFIIACTTLALNTRKKKCIHTNTHQCVHTVVPPLSATASLSQTAPSSFSCLTLLLPSSLMPLYCLITIMLLSHQWILLCWQRPAVFSV